MSIHRFHAELHASKKDPRLEALRRLTTFKNPLELVRKDDHLIFLCWPIWHAT